MGRLLASHTELKPPTNVTPTLKAPAVELEPDSAFEGAWRLISNVFHMRGSQGPAAFTNVPENLKGTTEPQAPLKEGALFLVHDGSWSSREDVPAITGELRRTMTLPQRGLERTMTIRDAERRATVLDEKGTYRMDSPSTLTLIFWQRWVQRDSTGTLVYAGGERIEQYSKYGGPPLAPRPQGKAKANAKPADRSD